MNTKNSLKIFRVLLSVFIIPTFVFMAVAACHCPMAQASSGELMITKAPSCCCPSGEKCDDNLVINKDHAVNTQAFEVEKLTSAFKTITSESTEVFSSTTLLHILQFSEVSPPSISHLLSVQLLI